MLKKLTYILYKILQSFDFILKKIFNRSFLVHLKDLIEKDSYTIKSINDKKIIFFTPNAISKWRINSLFKKETNLGLSGKIMSNFIYIKEKPAL